jgi:hypothetical protein
VFSRSPERLEERIDDPFVRIDDDIAIIWAPYEARSRLKSQDARTVFVFELLEMEQPLCGTSPVTNLMWAVHKTAH